MPDDKTALYFALFLEVGIIHQIGRTFLERRLPDGLLTTTASLSLLLRLPVIALGWTLGYLLIYSVLRSMLGRARRAAPALLWLLLALPWSLAMPSAQTPSETLFQAGLYATAVTFVVVRCGLLAATVGVMINLLLLLSIVTLDPGDWYFAPTAIIALLMLGLVLFGVRTAVGRRPPFPAGAG